MTAKRFLLSMLVLLLLVALGSGVALTQQSQSGQATVKISNICQESTLSISQLLLSGPSFKSLKIISGVALKPGGSASFNFNVSGTPTALTVVGAVDQRSFTSTFSPLALGSSQQDQSHCLQIFVTASGTGGQQPPPSQGKNGIVPGESLAQVQQLLQLRGIAIRTEGSQNKPKLSDVNDPMLLRALPPLNAQLIFVSSGTLTLRSLIAWDRPSTDLDLLVFGIGGSFCFQLNPAGILGEFCDRVPFGPVVSPIGVFAVLVINWSPVTQAFVLSLAG
ncbi:MAG TPA: hypothetical protein ENI60_03415 [Candidatus Fraserbacteria bacterium]|nr:hypothetical protein [Candidatus Fraserbacteria bacterium]